MLENPEEWLEYHRQYREARETWSVIPFEHWISRLNQLSQRLEIGDFGCGEAKIQEMLGERVHSFDHVAINENVTACDITSVPLENSSLDVVIFSLSLMGKNWCDYLKEAHRCLASNGYVFISETTRALEGRLSELRNILVTNGFEIYDNFENGNFTFIEARKI
jgi:SAM-dependent methyltransferase